MRDKILCKESTYDRVRQPPEVMLPLGGIHKKEDGARTAYEILSIVIGILALLISLGNMFVALLTFFDKRKKRK